MPQGQNMKCFELPSCVYIATLPDLTAAWDRRLAAIDLQRKALTTLDTVNAQEALDKAFADIRRIVSALFAIQENCHLHGKRQDECPVSFARRRSVENVEIERDNGTALADDKMIVDPRCGHEVKIGRRCMRRGCNRL